MNWAIKDLLIATVFIAFCSFLNASMDITIHNFNGSVYSKIGDFGSPTYKYFQSDWKNKWVLDGNGEPMLDENGKRIPKYLFGIKFPLFKHPMFFDSWHLFKTLMIGSLIAALISLYFAAAKNVFNWKRWQSWAIASILFTWFSLDWNLVFNLFYDNLLRL